MSYDPVDEILDRVRRIETRTTVIGRHLGADVGGGRPRWCQPQAGGVGVINVSTRNVSLGELMKVVPEGWDKGVHVYVNGDYLLSFTIVPQ
jgi:hypothetical protein